MSDRKEFQKIWLTFRREVLGPEASPALVIQMRRAFYAGAISYRGIIDKHFAENGSSDEPSAEDLALVSGLNDELEEFFEQAKAGIV